MNSTAPHSPRSRSPRLAWVYDTRGRVLGHLFHGGEDVKQSIPSPSLSVLSFSTTRGPTKDAPGRISRVFSSKRYGTQPFLWADGVPGAARCCSVGDTRHSTVQGRSGGLVCSGSAVSSRSGPVVPGGKVLGGVGVGVLWHPASKPRRSRRRSGNGGGVWSASAFQRKRYRDVSRPVGPQFGAKSM